MLLRLRPAAINGLTERPQMASTAPRTLLSSLKIGTEFRILGPVEVLEEGRPLALGGPRQRALLALLLLHANEVVATDRLIDELWTAGGPQLPQTALQNHILRLRKVLGDRITSRAPGYAIRVDPGELDLDRFEHLVAAAAELQPAERAGMLADALALWRGAPLASVAAESFATVEAGRLEELRLAALEERIDADLELGRHAELVGELRTLAAEHPIRERLSGQLMLALYRCGRQAEALDVFRDVRERLDSELGLEPGPTLRALELGILRQDPSLVRKAGSKQAPRRQEQAQPEPPAKRAATTRPTRKHAPSKPRVPKRPTPKPRPGTTNPVPPPAATAIDPPPPPAPAPAPQPDPPAPSSPAPPSPPAPPSAAPSSPPPPPPPPPPPHPRPQPMKRTSEDFADGYVNQRDWYTFITGTSTAVAERNGRLEVLIGADAIAGGDYNVIDGQLGTTCRFPGDFDARVEFELLSWPSTNGVSVELAAFGRNGGVNVARSSKRWGEQYGSWLPPANFSVVTADLKGKLRLRRSAGVLTGYFWNITRWIKLGSGRSTGAFTLVLHTVSNNEDFADAEVQVAFDNFVVDARSPVC
jgi:DNA-binding SARP family transcriptional activator